MPTSGCNGGDQDTNCRPAVKQNKSGNFHLTLKITINESTIYHKWPYRNP